MLRIEKFDPKKVYMFVDGSLATAEALRKANPAIDMFTHVLELNGDVVQAVMNLSALRGIYNIDSSLSEADAIMNIETITNTPAPVIVSPEERTAAAMEFANLMMLDDAVVSTEPTTQLGVQSNKALGMVATMADVAPVDSDPHASLIKRNFDRGLWSKQMVAKALAKGVITPEHHDEIVSNPIETTLK